MNGDEDPPHLVRPKSLNSKVGPPLIKEIRNHAPDGSEKQALLQRFVDAGVFDEQLWAEYAAKITGNQRKQREAQLNHWFGANAHDDSSGSPGKSGRRARIVRPPAHRMDAILEWVLPAKTYDEVFGEMITDMRVEYCDALAKGHSRKARWIHGRVYIILGATILTWIPTALAKRIVAMWKAF